MEDRLEKNENDERWQLGKGNSKKVESVRIFKRSVRAHQACALEGFHFELTGWLRQLRPTDLLRRQTGNRCRTQGEKVGLEADHFISSPDEMPAIIVTC